MKNKIKFIVGVAIVVFTVGFTIFVGTNYYLVHDTLRSWNYNPTPEIAAVQSKLNLTESGDLIFKSTSPALDESKDFNEHCQSHDQSTAILGCYSDSNIYVYNVQSEDLDGIIEATVAHEMMHAIWARLSNEEREGLTEDLKQVYQNNHDALSIVDEYAEESKFDELFARIGTQVRDIPERLEAVYARYFTNRLSIVRMYERYRSVFDALTAETESLLAEITTLKQQIDTDTQEYIVLSAQFNSEAEEFGECANRSGCFASQYEFNTRRSELLDFKAELDELYERITVNVNECNAKIEAYNQNVTKTNQYIEVINSNIERIKQ